MITNHDIPMALRAAYLTMHRQTNTCLSKCGITADQFVCLLLLAERDGITQQELVRRATSDPNTIRAMLVLLEKRGLVKRCPHPDDGRALNVTITPEGRKILKDLAAEVKPVQERMKEPFSGQEAEMLVNLLSRVTDSMR